MLPQNTLSHAHRIKLRWLVTLSTVPLLGVVTAFGIMPQTVIPPRKQQVRVEEIVLPQTTPSIGRVDTFWHSERIQPGDTIAELLRRLNVDDPAASDYLRNHPSATVLRRLSAGKAIQAETDGNGLLLSLYFLTDDRHQVIIERTDGGFATRTIADPGEQRIQVRTGKIRSTLYAAADEAGLPDAIASQMAEIFGGDIDFHRDLRKGDRFTVIYEMHYIYGEAARTGRILAAEFINRNKTYRAAWFQTTPYTGDYYSPDGKSLRKAFLRSPLEFSRVSSGFTRSRFHPVLHKWRAHKGVDYAAPIGTKVKVTGDGVVSFVGRLESYGNVVKVSHPGNFITVYGHLSRFAGGLHKGQKLQQGQIIGYVGMTGLASGPHLHYEFQQGGIPRDPLKVALPSGKPVSPEQMDAFLGKTHDLFARLDDFRTLTIARLDE